jgi:hypothetical protein
MWPRSSRHRTTVEEFGVFSGDPNFSTEQRVLECWMALFTKAITPNRIHWIDHSLN